jgi:hypothetical protein
MRVSLLSRYGTCTFFFFAASLSALITLPSARRPLHNSDNDGYAALLHLLMATLSLKRSPSLPVVFWRSLPARSTK